MTSRSNSMVWMICLGLVAVLVAGGCSEDTVAPVIGNTAGTVVSGVTVSTTSADVGASVIVEATVQNTDGIPQAGIWVSFTVAPSASGSFTADSAITDANGIASTIFNPSTPGSIAISASIAGGSTQSQPLTVTSPGTGGGGSGLVTVAISPTLMQADGVTIATVTVTAFTPASQLVPDSTPVKMAAGEWFIDVDGDGFFTAVIDTLKVDYNANGLWDAIGQIPSVLYTTNGVATTTYTAGSTAGTVYFLATVGSPGSSYSNRATVALTPNDSVASIQLVASQPNIQVFGTGGDDFTNITAQAFDAFGNAAPQGLAISLTIVSGPGGGEGINGTVGQPVAKTTDASGRVTWTVASGTISGTLRLRATAGSVLSTAIHVVVNAGPPFEISLGAQSCNIQSWLWVNLTNPIVAVVVDAYGNPVPAGTAVYFSTEEGSVSAYDVTEEDGGVAFVQWRSGDPKNDGLVWIKAETAGGTVLDSTLFISSGPATAINVLSAPTSLPASPNAKAQIVLEVLDVNSNYVVGATVVDVFTSFGGMAGGGTSDGCNYSILTTEFFSESPLEDYSPVSPDDGIAAVAVISATVGLTGNTFTINLTSGNAYFRNSTMDYFGTIVYGGTVPVEVTIRDRNFVPLGGHTVALTSTAGAIGGSPAITDRYGVATFLYTAVADSSFGKSAYLTATDSDPRGGITVVNKVSFVDFIRPKPGDDPTIPASAEFSDPNNEIQ